MLQFLEFEGWTTHRLESGRPYLEKMVNGHELRMIEKLTGEVAGTELDTTSQPSIYGFLDRWLIVEAADLANCAVFLVDWAEKNPGKPVDNMEKPAEKGGHN